MKVALVMPLAEQRGGAELMLLHLLRANQQGPKVDYHVAFLEDGPMVAAVQALGYPAQVFHAGHLRQAVQFLATVRALKGWMQREQVQVVMSWMAKAHLYAGPAAKMAGIPAVWWQHGIPGGHWLDRITTALPARKVFCCSQIAQRAQQTLFPKRETCVIYPAADSEQLAPGALPNIAEARQSVGLPETGPVIGIVCRLQRWKGVHVFLEAAAQVVQSHPDAHFVVVGGKHALEPNYPDALAMQVKHLGIEEKVCFVGYQPNSALWMQAMDVVVHGSVGAEPFGMVVIEAMALGKTVIASKAGGPLEVIEDGMDGFLTPPGDAAALAEMISRVISEPNHLHDLSQAARRKAAKFGTDRLAVEVARSLQLEVP